MIDEATGQELEVVQPTLDEVQAEQDALAMAEAPAEEVQLDTSAEEAGLLSNITKGIKKLAGEATDAITKEVSGDVAPKAKPAQAIPTPKPQTPKEPNADDDLIKYGVERIKKMKPEKKATPQEIATIKKPIHEMPQKQIDEEVTKEFALDMKQSDISHYDTSDKWQINFNTIKDKESLDSTIAFMADANREAIVKARGGNEDGVLTDQMLNGMARDLGEAPEKIFQAFMREDGFLPPPEYILAARQLMEQSARQLKGLSQKIVDGDDSSNILLEFHNHQQFHYELIQGYMGVRAQYGRGTRAMGAKMEDMESQQMMEIMGRIGSGMDIREMAKQIATMDTVGGINSMTKAQKSLSQYTRDKFFGYFVSSILSGVTTQGINIIGSSLNLGMAVADRALAARLGAGVASESDRVAVGEASAMTYAMLNSMNDARKIAWQVFKTGEPYGGMSKLDEDEFAEELPSTRLGLQDGSWGQMIVDGLDYGLTFMTKNVMASTDAFYKVLAERAEVSAQIFRAGAHEANMNGADAGKQLMQKMYDNIPADIQKAGQEQAEYVTFQTPLGESGRKVQEFFGMEGFRWFVPFRKTPINVMKQGYLDRNPLSMVAQKYRNEITAGGSRAQIAKARMLNGSIFMGMATALAMSGRMTGTADKDARHKGDVIAGEEQRSFVFEQDDGKKMYVSFDRLEPFSYYFGVAADIAKFYKDMEYEKITDEDEQKTQRVIDSTILAFAENTTNKAFFTGANTLMELLTAETKGKALDNLVNNLANGIIPYSGMRRNLAYLTDEKIKDPEGTWEYIKANTPTASGNIKNKLDIFGEEIEKKNPIPWLPKYGTNDQVKLEIQRITDKIRQAPVPAVMDRVKGVALTRDEHIELTELSRKNLRLDGRTFYETLKIFINSSDYKSLIDYDKVVELRAIAQEYDEVAKDMMAEKYPKFKEKMERLESVKDMLRGDQESMLQYELEIGEQ